MNKLPTTGEHIAGNYTCYPGKIAQHLREAHGIEPASARKGYEREVWRGQHEHAHYAGISGFIREIPSDHTAQEEEGERK